MNLYPVSLHPGQLALFHDKRPVVIGMFGRRGGKSYYGINTLPMKALSFQGQTSLVSPEKVLAAMPTFKQAKEIIWKPLVDICTYTDLAKYVKNINRTDYEIEFYGRKPKIVVRGVAEGLRGGRLYYFWGDEWQDAGNTAFDEIVSPALADTPNSSALITGTPKGKINILYRLSERAKEHPNVYGFHNYPTWVNPNKNLLKEIWIAKRVLPPKVWEQEYKASFVNFDGQIYSELAEENRPSNVNGLTHISSIVQWLDYTVLGVDWGQTSPAMVVLGYKLDNRREVDQVYVLEGWQGDGSQPIPMPVFEANALRLSTKWNTIATFCDPSQPSSILSLRSLGQEHNQQGLKQALAGYNRIDEGILQTHSLIYQRKLLYPKLSFGTSKGSCTANDIYDKAIAYHYKSKDGLVSQQVEDKQDDHCLDAIRYAIARKKTNP